MKGFRKMVLISFHFFAGILASLSSGCGGVGGGAGNARRED